jgi:hypothetical protein
MITGSIKDGTKTNLTLQLLLSKVTTMIIKVRGNQKTKAKSIKSLGI